MSIWIVRILLVALPLWLIGNHVRKRLAGLEPVAASRGNILLAAVWLALLLWVIAQSLQDGGAPGSAYRPAHVENGRIVPGEIEPAPGS